MALVVVASAKGAPGVTTLTVALGALTPGAIVADLDPDGGDLALRYGREDGTPLDPDLGLLSLAASLRRDQSEVVSQTGPVDEHLQVADGGLDLLLGVAGPDQAIGLGPLWAPLARALAGTDRTVFADCGRLGPASPAMPVLMQADAVLLLARAELDELAHLRERLRFLTATLPGRYTGAARVGVVLVARDRDRAAGPRTEQLLRASGLSVPVLGTIADDARGADRLRGLRGGRAGRTTLVRSVRSLLPAVINLAGMPLTGPTAVPTVVVPEPEPVPEPERVPDPGPEVRSEPEFGPDPGPVGGSEPGPTPPGEELGTTSARPSPYRPDPEAVTTPEPEAGAEPPDGAPEDAEPAVGPGPVELPSGNGWPQPAGPVVLSGSAGPGGGR